MKNKYLYICFLILVSTQSVKAQTITALDILKLTDKALADLTTFSYQIDAEMKFFSEKDTVKNGAICYLKSVPKVKTGLYHHVEELYGFYPFRYKQIYNGDSIVNFRANDSSALIINTKRKGSYNFIRGLPNLIRYEYFKQSFFTRSIQKKTVIDVQLNEEMYNGAPCYVVRFANTKGAKNSHEYTRVAYYINKENYLPVRMTETIGFQDMIQYRAYTISHMKLNPALDQRLFEIESNIPVGCIREYFNPDTYYRPNDHQLLKKRDMAPDITLQTIDGKVFDLNAYKGKVVLLDFWYISCYPCIMTLPELQKIAEHYDTSKVAVIGINVADDRDKIASFLGKRNITYINAFKGEETGKNYKIKAFPTLYIIDKKGLIVSHHEGWNRLLYKSTIKRKINKSLRKK